MYPEDDIRKKNSLAKKLYIISHTDSTILFKEQELAIHIVRQKSKCVDITNVFHECSTLRGHAAIRVV